MNIAALTPEPNEGRFTVVRDEVNQAIIRLANQLEDFVSPTQRANAFSNFGSMYGNEAILPLETIAATGLLRCYLPKSE